MMESTLFIKQFYLLSTGKVILESPQGDLCACEEDPILFRGGIGEEYNLDQIQLIEQLSDVEHQELVHLLICNAAVLPPLRVYAQEIHGNLIIGHSEQPSLFISMSPQEIEQLTPQDCAQLGTMIGATSIAFPHAGNIEQDTLIVL